MGYKYFIVTLLFGLNLWPTLVAAKGVDNHLTEKMCQGLGSFKQECLSTLKGVSVHENVDVKSLALFTLRYIESAKLTSLLKDFAKKPNLSHMQQDAIKDCIKQYVSVEDLVKIAINDVQREAYPHAEKSINTAISNVGRCDDVFKQEHPQKQTKKEKDADIQRASAVKEDIQRASAMKEVNKMVKNYLSMSLNIVKAHN